MNQFDILREQLSDHGVELRLQWEFKREQATVRHYLVRGGKIFELLIFLWPDGGYSSYFPAETIDISEDIERIAK